MSKVLRITYIRYDATTKITRGTKTYYVQFSFVDTTDCNLTTYTLNDITNLMAGKEVARYVSSERTTRDIAEWENLSKEITYSVDNNSRRLGAVLFVYERQTRFTQMPFADRPVDYYFLLDVRGMALYGEPVYNADNYYILAMTKQLDFLSNPPQSFIDANSISSAEIREEYLMIYDDIFSATLNEQVMKIIEEQNLPNDEDTYNEVKNNLQNDRTIMERIEIGTIMKINEKYLTEYLEKYELKKEQDTLDDLMEKLHKKIYEDYCYLPRNINNDDFSELRNLSVHFRIF